MSSVPWGQSWHWCFSTSLLMIQTVGSCEPTASLLMTPTCVVQLSFRGRDAIQMDLGRLEESTHESYNEVLQGQVHRAALRLR